VAQHRQKCLGVFLDIRLKVPQETRIDTLCAKPSKQRHELDVALGAASAWRVPSIRLRVCHLVSDENGALRRLCPPTGNFGAGQRDRCRLLAGRKIRYCDAVPRDYVDESRLHRGVRDRCAQPVALRIAGDPATPRLRSWPRAP
jgi:hypothetical protein